MGRAEPCMTLEIVERSVGFISYNNFIEILEAGA